MDIEEPISGWDCSTLHFHATLAGMLSATLIRKKVIQVRKSREKRLLTATGMVQPFHGKELPLDGVMGLIQQVLVTGIRGSSRTAYHPAFLSCTQRRTRAPLSPAVGGDRIWVQKCS